MHSVPVYAPFQETARRSARVRTQEWQTWVVSWKVFKSSRKMSCFIYGVRCTTVSSEAYECCVNLPHTLGGKGATIVVVFFFPAAWLSDKPLVQRDFFVRASLLHRRLRCSRAKTLFFCSFFRVLVAEWGKIDRNRTNKFLLFCRIFLAEWMHVMRLMNWDETVSDFLGETRSLFAFQYKGSAVRVSCFWRCASVWLFLRCVLAVRQDCRGLFM